MVTATVARPHGRSLRDIADAQILRSALLEDAEVEEQPQLIQILPQPHVHGGPEMLVGVHGDRGVLWWSHPDQDEDLIAVGGDNPELVMYHMHAGQNDFPPNSELPLDAVIEAAVEFLRTGLRPSGVTWADYDEAWADSDV